MSVQLKTHWYVSTTQNTYMSVHVSYYQSKYTDTLYVNITLIILIRHYNTKHTDMSVQPKTHWYVSTTQNRYMSVHISYYQFKYTDTLYVNITLIILIRHYNPKHTDTSVQLQELWYVITTLSILICQYNSKNSDTSLQH